MNIGEDFGAVKDSYFIAIKNSKDKPVVEKAKFATFASSIPGGTKIFSYEGPDDKVIYDHWIRRIKTGLRYEPYVCKNKSAALQLFDALERDRTGLGDEVFFFVDRDFDFLQGRTPTEKIFVTDRYSVENYVVCPRLLEDLLKIEFHCNGFPRDRANVVARFNDAYAQFLEVTKEANFRIFLSRRLSIRQLDDLPTRINLIAKVDLLEVSASAHGVTEIVKLEREPSAEELEALRPVFDEIEAKAGYRGKFALLFFIKWLGLLRQDRFSVPSILFTGVPVPENTINGNFAFDTLASKASPPEGLPAFLDAIAA